MFKETEARGGRGKRRGGGWGDLRTIISGKGVKRVLDDRKTMVGKEEIMMIICQDHSQ